MRIDFIGARGYPVSYACAEDVVRELGPRLVRDGHEVTIHCWETDEARAKGLRSDVVHGIRRVFHRTPGGKVSGQFAVALKASVHAARSDADLVCYLWINSAILSFIPRLAGKKVFINVDGMMWHDPKWPWGVRHVFFTLGAYWAKLFGNKVITDSFHMQEIYKNKFKLDLDWAGYGCPAQAPVRIENEYARKYPEGYYLIMSRITPHNLTDVMVDGFIQSRSRSHLLIAGHTPDTLWYHAMVERSRGHNVTFLGLVKDQNELNQLILNARGYLHGHSLGGINSALVRVVGANQPVICVDTVFNREVVEYPNSKLQARLFDKTADSVSTAIRDFEAHELDARRQAHELGATIRSTMSWESIYDQYRTFFAECFGQPADEAETIPDATRASV
jgi:glycosyltransferase involved in cell wall biosynthesis